MSWPSSHSVLQGGLSAPRSKQSRGHATDTGQSLWADRMASVAVQGPFGVSAARTANPTRGEQGRRGRESLLSGSSVPPQAQASVGDTRESLRRPPHFRGGIPVGLSLLQSCLRAG